jgi:hypothetical protein
LRKVFLGDSLADLPETASRLRDHQAKGYGRYATARP